MNARKISWVLAVLCVSSLCVAAWAARPALSWRPESYAVHRAHSHHLSAVHHAHVLSSYNAQSVPREVYVEHVNDIQRNVEAAAKTAERFPANVQGAEATKAVTASHATALTTIKSIREEVGKPSPNYEQVNTWATSLHQGLYQADQHLHGIHAVIRTSPIHKRLHPGGR